MTPEERALIDCPHQADGRIWTVACRDCTADAIRAALRERDAAHKIALKKARADALDAAAALVLAMEDEIDEDGVSIGSLLFELASRIRALLEEAGK